LKELLSPESNSAKLSFPLVFITAALITLFRSIDEQKAWADDDVGSSFLPKSHVDYLLYI